MCLDTGVAEGRRRESLFQPLLLVLLLTSLTSHHHTLTTPLTMIMYVNYTHKSIQWNLSNRTTNGAEESGIVSEVSSFQRLKCMQE